jgi:hypothetical protein
VTIVMDFLSLLTATFLFQPGFSSSTPVQVDLIFPKNNTVYQPVYPFPFVFAVHNFSKAWQYKPAVFWKLEQFSPTRNLYPIEGGFVGWDIMTAQETWAPPPDKFLAINSSNEPSQDIISPTFPDPRYHSNETSWTLVFSILFSSSHCSERIEHRKRIFFNTSINSGVMPDLRAFGSCPNASVAIGVEGQSQMNETCVQVTSLDPAPCAFPVDQQILDRVSKEMVDITKCSNVTWPNGTGIGTQCKWGKSLSSISSESNVLRWNSYAMGFSIIILVVISSLA